jgi:glycosyltransferase involved in cell wall biosynthesis
MEKIPISVLVPVKNEIANIRACLRGLEFADEIVVVDSASTDGTIAAAEEMGARVVQFKWDGRFPRKRNWSLENIPWRHEWILIVDADERITPELAAEIRQAMAQPKFDGYYLNRRFWFLGGWIRHCGYFPSWNLRLFRHQLGRYERVEEGEQNPDSYDNEVHVHVLLKGTSGYLQAPMDHFAFPTYEEWIAKHNRYSTWEAAVAATLHEGSGGESLSATPFGSPMARKRWLKRAARRLPGRPMLRFLYHYVLKQGFRDGWRGWVLCRSLAWYEWVGQVKARERTLPPAG